MPHTLPLPLLPPQLVLYPLLDLTAHTRDLHWYLRALEEVVVGALSSASGLQGERLPGLTGGRHHREGGMAR